VSPRQVALAVAPTAADASAREDKTGVELKRGAFLNTIAMLASNFRGIFTFLVARLLGPAALGTFSVAWANTDLVSKIAVLMPSQLLSPARKRRAISRVVALSFAPRLCWFFCSRV